MKKRWIVMGVAAVTAAAVLGVNMNGSCETEVSGVAIRPQRVEQTVSCVGVVEAADGVAVLLPIDCQIKRVKVKVGQRVKKGDVLATLDRESTGAAAQDPSERLILAALEDDVVAPEDGVVVAVQGESGKALDKGTPCAVIARNSDIQVRIAIREKDLKQLRKGMSVRIKGDGFTRDSYAGELAEISSAARTETEGGTVVEGIVTMDTDQIDDSLRLGLTAKAMVITSVTEDGLVIPYDAVLSDEQGDYVYVCADGKAEVRRVESSVRTATGVMVSQDGWDGALVITAPGKVSEGMAVSVKEETT